MTASRSLVLIVDDEELVRWVAAAVLEEGGFDVAEASNAQDAINVMEYRSDVRLLFTDIQMPGAFDGLELVRRVRKRWPHIRLVVTSGRMAPNAKDIPDDGYFLAKPYRDGDLLAKVTQLIGQP